ncbi:MAG: response regulator, partial [Armatimonadetes bacterium]|nr:response regulator [Armatimonadota bacterium]
VKDSADSLLSLLNDILDFSKIEAGKLDFETIGFSLRDSLGDTMNALALRAHTKGLELACRVLSEVPDALVGDPMRLRQVIVNLVGNAIKFTDRGEVLVEVGVYAPPPLSNDGDDGDNRDRVSEAREPDQVALHFSVRDTGIGILPEKQELIFEAFEQVDASTTRKYGGTGLGLTISAQLVRLMGGRIWVESEEQKGSVFHFTAQFSLQQAAPEASSPVKTPDLRDLPVLVVDDNATNRRILEEVLANWRMNPKGVDSAEAALAALEKARDEGAPIPLVLLDAMMPEMDGFGLAERIKHDPLLTRATLMMLSSANRQDDAARCRELGVAAYMTKPVKQSDLLDAILTALDVPHTTPETDQQHLGKAERPLRILLAEDNSVNRRLAVGLLEKRGHSVVVAENGREVIASLYPSGFQGRGTKSREFDLILMDVQMPEMDGLEATAALRDIERETGAHLSIIAMTAHAMLGDRERFLEAGMDGFISKPLNARELIETVEAGVTAPGRRPDTTVRARDLSAEETRTDRSGPPPILDRAGLMARVDGNLQLAAEMVELFQTEDYPRLVTEIRDSIACRDSQGLQRAAHSLKGILGNLSATESFELALQLEAVGREGQMDHAEQSFAVLESAVERLKGALAALPKEGSPS